jgi:prepilin-type N-terminal cleavage/methylation domain-containing protein
VLNLTIIAFWAVDSLYGLGENLSKEASIRRRKRTKIGRKCAKKRHKMTKRVMKMKHLRRFLAEKIQEAENDLHTSRRGFTLVEVIIVVVILSIAAMMAIPMMSSAGSVQIRSAADAISADLEYARSMAISRQRMYSVVFDTANESYQIQDDTGTVIKHPVKRGFDYIIDFKNDNRMKKVDIFSVNFDGTAVIKAIKFDYLGSPYNESNSPLGNSGIITLQADGSIVTITVEPVTGFISVSN